MVGDGNVQPQTEKQRQLSRERDGHYQFTGRGTERKNYIYILIVEKEGHGIMTFIPESPGPEGLGA